jgi:hypothetical protein
MLNGEIKKKNDIKNDMSQLILTRQTRNLGHEIEIIS